MRRRWMLLSCLGALGGASPRPPSVAPDGPAIRLPVARHAARGLAADYRTPDGDLALVVADADALWVGGRELAAPWNALGSEASDARRAVLRAVHDLGTERVLLAADATLALERVLAIARWAQRVHVDVDLLVADPEPVARAIPPDGAPLDVVTGPHHARLVRYGDRRFVEGPDADLGQGPVALFVPSGASTAFLVDQLDDLRADGARTVTVSPFEERVWGAGTPPPRSPLRIGRELAVHALDAGEPMRTTADDVVPALGRPTVYGPLSTEVAAAWVRARAPELAACATVWGWAGFAPEPGDARATAHLVAAPGGEVVAIELRDATLEPRVARCVALVFATLRFPTRGCGMTTIDQPLLYTDRWP